MTTTEEPDEAAGGPDALAALLSALDEGEGAKVPTTTFGRLRRTAGVAFRMARGARKRDGVDGGMDPRAAAKLVQSLGQLKGIAMKMGQILSYIDPSMPEETRRLLSVLQIRSQPTPFAAVEAVLREELGERAERLLAELERKPVASASIGQVHRARLPDGTQVAVKVRHPGIDDAIRADFKSARVGKAFARMFAPGSDVAQVIDEAQARFLEECDYALEGRRQARFARLFADHPDLGVPAVHPDWSATRVLTTTWCAGMGFEDYLASEPSQADRDRLGRALFEFYVGTLYGHGLFNADPHPGNLVFTGDDELVVLDYGCVREFEGETVGALAALSRAVRADDDEAMQEALERLGLPAPRKAFDVTKGLLTGFFGPVLTPGARPIEAGVDLRARQVFKSKRAMLKLRLPGKLLFLFRIRFGLYAVLSRLGAALDWTALEEEMAARCDVV